ncbi:MAG: polymerase III, alpha subunit protein [Parcubacteria group bacterium GW2011_GWB1_57_6]|nr:MAG: polymerase III, alpha subunit protein [Parcubacteria group bacterium GW2011_GWA1_56_13]KKW45339.1 MAG: polymerase III, alpha subunit protein [Parcubacteria group bacterium GW2011_GWB1_57_6]
MNALALTDTGNMHGAIEFYKAATNAGVKPILGVDTYLAPRSRHEKDPNIDTKRSRIVLLAENNEGYKNLLALVTKSWTEGFFERPRIDKELLRERGRGLIAILPSFAGDVAQLLRAGDRNGAAAALAEFKNMLGAQNVFLEITHHPKVAGHEALMQSIIELASESGTPLVAQHDVYYLEPGDREATETMRRIQQGGRGRNEDEDFSFISDKTARSLFHDTPEAIDNARAIADRCTVTFELGKWTFPSVPVSSGFKNHDEELRAKAYAGIKVRGLADTQEVKDRIEYELDIIIGKGFAVYYLIVADLLAFARTSGILTTTRGSAAGSLVAYLIGITNVDPLFYKLPFERFLNPLRPKAPDIDMDMADDRRDEMIEYTKRKYGTDHVAQIGTFGTMMARAAVRDVARALGHSYNTGDRIAKLIPIGSQGFPMTIDRALELEPDLKLLYDEDEDAREIIDLAKRIEGCVRHVGVHAAGVVVAPTPLIEWAPIQPDPKGTGKLITQYDMYSITDEYGGVGLLKFDFLGIKNLAILADAVARVKGTRGITVDIENVPLDDAKTFEMLARGETEGTFQLGGSGMTRWLKELRPTTIHDINAMVALYRPGPMETIPSYIERKHNPKLIKYLDPRMKEYLDFSYGILVYQDDVLLTAIKLGGYSWLEADALRKAMGKKIPKVMQAEKEKLTKGFMEYGKLSKQLAEKLWELIEPFAAYGFNKAHAASYGKVAYQTAYMKANYPVEYLAALLTADAGDTEQVSILVAEAKRMGIPVLPPDVNESGAVFTTVQAPMDVPREEGLRRSGGDEQEENSQQGIIPRSSSGTPSAQGTPMTAEEYRSKGTVSFSAENAPRSRAGALREPFLATHLHPSPSAPNAIRFGLSSIKNFGEGISEAIIAERNARGPFKTLSDFLLRIGTFGSADLSTSSPSFVGSKSLNRKSLESLIKCGALDSLGERGTLLKHIENLLTFHREATVSAPQDSLFGALSAPPELSLPAGSPTSLTDKLIWEKELLGIYVSGHPLDAHTALTKKTRTSITKIKEERQRGMTVILPLLITLTRSVLTRSGEKMAFLTVEDTADSIEAVVFPKLFKEHGAVLTAGACLLAKAKVSVRGGELSLALEDIKPL